MTNILGTVVVVGIWLLPLSLLFLGAEQKITALFPNMTHVFHVLTNSRADEGAEVIKGSQM